MNWKETLRTRLEQENYLDLQSILSGKEIDPLFLERLSAGLTIPDDYPETLFLTDLKLMACEAMDTRNLRDDIRAISSGEILDDESFTSPEPLILPCGGQSIDADLVEDFDIPCPPPRTVKLSLAIGCVLFSCVSVFALMWLGWNKEVTEVRERAWLSTSESLRRESITLSHLGDEREKLKIANATIEELQEKVGLMVAFRDAGMKASSIEETRELLKLADEMPYGSPFRGGHKVTSEYGLRDERWFQGNGTHDGIDIVPLNWSDNVIQATMEGEIIDYGISPTYGKYITMENYTHTVRIKYAHLSKIFWQDLDKQIVKGVHIMAGDKLGVMGDTGLASGPHLHFEIHLLVNGEWVLLNPTEIIAYVGNNE